MKKREKIIVWIDENWDIMDRTMEPLRKDGFDVFTFYSGGEAFEEKDLLRRACLIIVDPFGIDENNLCDFELLEKILMDEEIKAFVVIFTSPAHFYTHSKDRFKNYGVKDIIIKAIFPTRFKQRIEEILDTY